MLIPTLPGYFAILSADGPAFQTREAAPAGLLSTLARRKPLPLVELFAADLSGTDVYRFYATAWALVHHLNASSGGRAVGSVGGARGGARSAPGAPVSIWSSRASTWSWRRPSGPWRCCGPSPPMRTAARPPARRAAC